MTSPSSWSAASAATASCDCRNRPGSPGRTAVPPKHGPEFRFAKTETWPEPAVTTATDTTNYGKPQAQAWDRVHNIRAHVLCPARVPQPRGTGRGRPPGSKNQRRAPRYDVGKTVKRAETLAQLHEARR